MRRISQIIVGSSAAFCGAYGILVATKAAPTYRYKVTTSSENPKEFNQSFAVTKHGNPGGHVAFNHCLSVIVRIPERHGQEGPMTDEQILVRMVKGYYGGWTIAPERWVFAISGADIVDFEGAPKRGNTWSPASSLQESLPPLHHVLIGAFQVLDRHIVGSKHSKEKNGDSHPPLLEMEEMHASLSAEQSTTSYIDFGFGKNRGTFGGINRFAVTSLPNDGNSAEGVGEEANNGKPGRLVKLTLSAVACNPTQNTVATSKWIFDLHEFYANFLFREAVGRVLADC